MLFTDKNSDLKIKQITRLSEGSLFLLVTDLLCQSLAKVSRADNADVSFHILVCAKNYAAHRAKFESRAKPLQPGMTKRSKLTT